jgi:hypothetical protein
MPGIIRVSVLEAVDLPKELTGWVDGISRNDLTAKVTLGPRLYKTEPGIADGGRIDSWNSEFCFPVMNLRDKLVVAICNDGDQFVTQTAIEIPSIIEEGSRDELVNLEGGGRIHLRMSFILTDVERKKIELMRLSTLKRREEERLKRTVVFQAIQPTYDDEIIKSSVSKVTVTEIDESTTDEKDRLDGPLGIGSTTEALVPILMFDYARAVGAQSCRHFQRTERRSKISDEVLANSCGVGTEGRCDFSKKIIGHQKPNSRNENRRGQSSLKAGAAALAVSYAEGCVPVEGQLGKGFLSSSSTYLPYMEQMQRCDRLPENRPLSINVDGQVIGQCGQGLKLEARSGPGMKWAHRTGLETRWTSPKEARRIIKEWNGRASDPLKARAKILAMINAAGHSHESYSHFRDFQDHHSLSDSFGSVFNRVVGGTAVLLAALFMMWPLVESSPHRGDKYNGDNR